MKLFKLLQDQFAHPRPNSILHNKYVLYFVMFIAIANLFSGLMAAQYIFVAYFVLVGFVLSFFSKNMIVILVLTVAISNVLKVILVGTALEGFQEGATNTDKKDKKDKKEAMTDKKDKKDGDVSSEEDKTEETNPKQKKSELVDLLKSDAKELLGAQKNIIQGFQEIEPYMKTAEGLIVKIDETTKKIKEINQSAK